jgi:hypothetical protein
MSAVTSARTSERKVFEIRGTHLTGVSVGGDGKRKTEDVPKDHFYFSCRFEGSAEELERWLNDRFSRGSSPLEGLIGVEEACLKCRPCTGKHRYEVLGVVA